MDLGSLVTHLGDVAWLGGALAMGLVARAVGLPPLVGFLAAGFLLSHEASDTTDALAPTLHNLADLGIKLLLFTIGLKLKLPTLLKPEVWGVTLLNMVLSVLVAVAGLSLVGLFTATQENLPQFALVAFALSFSSTVFVAKSLEEKGEVASLHGRIAIGILITQDIVAVGFLVVANGQVPSPWALLLFPVLWLARQPLAYLLSRVGHGELLVLLGLVLALSGAKLFELVGLKGDLGALAIGAIIAGKDKSEELAKTLLGFKDLFLLAFFLSVGLYGPVTQETAWLALLITPFILFKAALFFGLLIVFKQRARTALLAASNLTNFSEFGLIVTAISVQLGWLESQWLVAMAIALSLSFVGAAGLNMVANTIYSRYREYWHRFQRLGVEQRHELDLAGASTAIIGMGGIGSGTYDRLTQDEGLKVLGVDIDATTAVNQSQLGRLVTHGDPTDADFWDRLPGDHRLDTIIIALPSLASTKAVLRQLKSIEFAGKIIASARFADEEAALLECGADHVFNTYAEAGMGLAVYAIEAISPISK